MWSLIVLALAVGVSAGSPLEKEQLASKRHNIVEEINSMDTTFKAKRYEQFAGLSIEQLRNLVGAQDKPAKRGSFRLTSSEYVDSSSSQDSGFNVNDKWPQCNESFADTLVIGACNNSAWAASVSATIQDRRCIKHGLTDKISAWDVVSCSGGANDGTNGCNGGDFFDAFQWAQSDGVVTGGAHHSNVGCKPWPLSPFDSISSTTACSQKCTPPYLKKYLNDKIKTAGVVSFSLENDRVMAEIRQNGPLVTEFELYDDFPYYPGGIYEKGETAKLIGYTYAKIIGWGVDGKGLAYWRAVANFGGRNWGETGTFRILKGKNHIGFESSILGPIIV